MTYLYNFLLASKFNLNSPKFIADAILLLILIIISIIGYFLAKKAVVRVISRFIKEHNVDWAKIMLENHLFRRLGYFIPALIIYIFLSDFKTYDSWILRILTSITICIGISIITSFLNSINEIYRKFSISNVKPIKGYIQILKISIYFIGIIIIISVLINISPFIFLSGVGALTAVFLLIFKDSLLGLVAGVQLSSNDMVRLGDWIEIPKYGADGTVTDISLNTVKVQNFDKTITTIPTYALISDSFKNWRGMQDSGGRRIKRSVFIDTSSIKFCTEEMIEGFLKIQYLSDYIKVRQNEIAEYNKEHGCDSSELTNGRRMTNIGTFRAYISIYLKNHPNIHKDMTQMVRQLPSCENGLPLEIYAFTNDTKLLNYENIQSDVFDHILSVVPEFDLRIFQQPAGYDMRIAFDKDNLN